MTGIKNLLKMSERVKLFNNIFMKFSFKCLAVSNRDMLLAAFNHMNRRVCFMTERETETMKE